MKLYTEVYIILVLSTLLLDYLLYKQSKRSIFINIVFIFAPAIIFTAGFTWVKFFYQLFSAHQLPLLIMWFNMGFLAIYVPKFILVLSNIISSKKKYTISTIRIFRNALIALVLIVFAYSVFITPQTISVKRIDIPFRDLPTAFDNYTIVQFSDVHLGSRPNDPQFYRKLVAEINHQQPDIVVFTGDMVNNFASEMVDFDTLFLQIKSKDGNFAVLGNHDYGDYSVWDTEAEKSENLSQIKKSFKKFGFQLLNNESLYLKKKSDSIALIGVENYRKKAPLNYSNLQKSMKGVDSKAFKLLLSHNPQHWEREILPQSDIDLTLSGHTHAAQMGFIIFGKIFSPAVFLFKQYYGVYEQENQKIYVSRGVGYIGLPLLIGLNPEISVIKLNHKKNESEN